MTTRPLHELSPFERVLAVADRYEVEVVMLPKRGTWRAPRGASHGPAGHYADPARRRVYVESSQFDPHLVATELHEVVHCIVVPPRAIARRYLEHHGLLQFELALARAMFPSSSATDRRQVAGVRGYQGITLVDERRKISLWPRHDRTRWWAVGEAFMRRCGFLDEEGAPTWRRGTWPNDDALRAFLDDCERAVRATPSPPSPAVATSASSAARRARSSR